MTQRWPKTVRGWIELVAVVGGVLGAVAGGVWKLHTMNAYASDVRMSEQRIVETLEAFQAHQQSKTCAQWLSEITLLESREAAGQLSDGQRDRLIWLRNTYEAECRGEADG